MVMSGSIIPVNSLSHLRVYTHSGPLGRRLGSRKTNDGGLFLPLLLTSLKYNFAPLVNEV